MKAMCCQKSYRDQSIYDPFNGNPVMKVPRPFIHGYVTHPGRKEISEWSKVLLTRTHRPLLR